MYRFARVAALVIAAAFSFHAAGCESSSAPRRSNAAAERAPQVSQQLIVKFKPQSVACTAQAISRFSKSADLPLKWLRPMSGDACVVIQEASNPDELTRAQQRLKQHSQVEWVELDALMQHH
jgi:hypothetical protein